MKRRRQQSLGFPVEVPEDLSLEQQRQLWEWCQKHHPTMTKGRLRSYVNECLAHFDAIENPKGYTRWVAVCRQWITRAERWADDKREARPEARVDFSGTDGIGNVVELFGRRR